MVLTYFFIIMLTLFLISVYILSALKEYFYNREEVNLLTKANVVASMLSERETMPESDFEQTIYELFLDNPPRIMIIDTQTIVIYDNDSDNSLKGKIYISPTVKEALSGKDHSNTYKSEDTEDDYNLLEVAVPIIKSSNTVGVVYLRQSLVEVDGFLRDIRNTLLIIAVVINIIIGILSQFMADIITSPLEKLRQVAQLIADGDFSAHLGIKGSSEVVKLIEAFNTMSARLSELEQKRRRFVSDASHELKTPLSTIKLLCESLLGTSDPDPEMVKEFLADINNEIDRLNRIIERLLTLTKTDNQRAKIEFDTVRIAKTLNSVVKNLLPFAQNAGVEISFKCDDDYLDFEMLADRDKLFEAVYNICNNAIKYTKEGGYVLVSFEVEQNNIVISIEDSGIGIPKEDMAKIFDRFYRVDTARARDTGGTGLGLSIAQDAIVAHGGHIEVISEENVGSKFVIIIPYTGK